MDSAILLSGSREDVVQMKRVKMLLLSVVTSQKRVRDFSLEEIAPKQEAR